MRFFSTANNISQAFKNAGRVREILSVFVHHGFADLLHRMRLTRFIPAKYSAASRFKDFPMAVRLRLSCEELGPTFVKLGQVLATRPDLLPEAYVAEFEKLHDKVATVPFSEVKTFIESELGKPIHEVFSEFEENPMAAASIAQVYGAVLKTGERVAVKVQRPGIGQIIQSDVSILKGLAALLEKYVPESKVFDPVGVVEEFFRSMLYELDFLVEANNLRRIRKNLSGFEKVGIPKVYSHVSTAKVLVLERFYGVRFSDRSAIEKMGINPDDIVRAGSDVFFHMVMVDGLFHGDLHAGNLFILEDGRIGIIDFGIVGRLSRRVQDSVLTIFVSLVEEDYETLASEYVMLCPSSGQTDIVLLQKDMMDTISPYVGMPLGSVNVGQLLLRSATIATKHNLQVPRELMLLFKAILSIEGLGNALNPSFDMMEVGAKLARQTISTRYSKERILRDLAIIGRDAESLIQTTPRLLKRFLREWSKDDFAFKIRNRDTAVLADSIKILTHTLLNCAMAFGFFALGITFFVMDRGPSIADFSLWGILSFGSGIYVIARWLYLLRKKRS
jgi:ubiquinone biosynthesis protein